MLVELSDGVWRRLRARVDGLTDDEYFWEPAPGCWSIRMRPDGTWRSDGALPRPDPEPFTTIAWRLWHLIDLYGENRAPEWLDVPPQGSAIGLDDPDGAPPSSANDAIDLLERAHDRWDAHLALVTEDQLAAPVGPVGGAYAERSRAGYVLHMLDEYIHHGAEVALLRDLWRWQRPVADPLADALTERAIRGDMTVIDDLPRRRCARTDRRRQGARPPLRRRLVSRWELVAALVEGGVSPQIAGRSPLHQAAIVGELGLVQLLVEHGADPSARDPQFHATPVEWARSTGR